MLKDLKDFKPGDPNLAALKILLNGQVGAGKSSFINSINSIFQGHVMTEAFADNARGQSFTKTYKTYTIENRSAPGSSYAFVFNDVMGLEAEEQRGTQVDDIISALKGHIKEDYPFNPVMRLSDKNLYYNKSPSRGDKVHCIVTVVAADQLAIIDDKMIEKQKRIREAATELHIPQVAVLTKVDEACPLVKKDLRTIYRSRYIKEQIERFSYKLGIPVNCIVPVKNYHNELDLNENMDILLLKALTHIVNFGNDYVRKCPYRNEETI
ncbi:hypothetical protein JZ751_009997 [Albula glossodonta]|uniref:KAP NTPase domain-containing protein n=1 Tax=Albula glossodonta TaxID=121402 RepID=A0A8T2NBG7_9TELE|nr:hypothetical protein JZ751_009997 [Albula glossodonta]